MVGVTATRYPADMSAIATLVKVLDTAHWELGEAFAGMPADDLWRRPHPLLWSVGELAAHMAYGLDVNIVGGTAGGPLVAAKVRYYDPPLGDPVQLDLTPEAVYVEVMRVWQLAKAVLLALPGSPEDKNPYRDDWTWFQTAEYMGFHTAYHTGQIFSARHMMGHVTTDN